MTLTTLLLIYTLAQTPAPTPSDVAAQAAQKAAESAERAAIAAEKTAAAVQQMAQAAAATPVVAPAPAAPPAPPTWTGTTGLGLIWLTGNSSTLTFNGNGAAKRQWTDWAFGLKGYGSYGLSRAANSSDGQQVTALSAGAEVRGDRNFGTFASVFISGGVATDHVKSVEVSEFGELGTGLTWIDVKAADYQKTLLRTDLAAHIQHDSRFQYYPTPSVLPSVNLLGPRVAVAFRYALNKEVIFSENAEIIPSILGEPSGRVLIANTAKISSRLTSAASLNVAYQVNYDSAPAEGKVPTDTALMVGVDFAL